ncbi:MAG: 3-deoxy-D-manno-octulosonic acid transferase [Magnetovibrio sp.]|nr:3-deoxy-D-manno-octulosonic acid transferase [Magnetovibrio sp.]
MKLTLYRMVTSLGGPFIRYYLNQRLKTGKEDQDRFEERLGIASLPRPAGKLMWIHAASVGESLSALPLIERFFQDHKDWQILVTTGTVTSARLMIERLPKNARHQFLPVDRVSYVRRFLEHWQPDLALWVESELWPNLVIESRARAVPMVIFNGRMSERSFVGWTKHKAMIRRLLSAFKMILAQSEVDAERFLELGAKNVSTPGNIKFCTAPLPVEINAFENLNQHIGARPVWLASSTHDGEEILCGNLHADLKDHIEGLLTIIVPRHPERGEDVRDQLTKMGLNVALRSQNQDITSSTDVYVADSMGELGLFYRLCPVVFMGKTFAKGGGQNPIEPAQLECALVFGPDMGNFADSADKLIKAKGAFSVTTPQDLAKMIKTLLCDINKQTKTAQSAHTVATSEAHVLDRVMEKLAPFLERGGDT